jgi:hypothetical protein
MSRFTTLPARLFFVTRRMDVARKTARQVGNLGAYPRVARSFSLPIRGNFLTCPGRADNSTADAHHFC